ncbi:MAG: gluconate 2-dehydrogenase subunit 3 family protein [Bacteroidota bacterium]|nr:gluconate 2-dehydrogenase subunit 3 family protein [Bacteroidota bacterium]
MNRRKAILSFVLIGGGAGAGFSGYTWFRLQKTPDIGYLDQNRAFIADLAETIIPATDTPGAKAAGAEVIIIKLIKDSADRKTKNIFIDGLKTVADHCQSEYHNNFSSLTAQQQQAVMGWVRNKSAKQPGIIGKVKDKVLGKSFFHILKEYTTIAFCTSKTGASDTLAYNFIPGAYNACMPMTPGQKAWATK